MAIPQSIEEMKEKLRKEIGDGVDDMDRHMVKEYYMSWFHGGSGGCACTWEDSRQK